MSILWMDGFDHYVDTPKYASVPAYNNYFNDDVYMASLARFGYATDYRATSYSSSALIGVGISSVSGRSENGKSILISSQRANNDVRYSALCYLTKTIDSGTWSDGTIVIGFAYYPITNLIGSVSSSTSATAILRVDIESNTGTSTQVSALQHNLTSYDMYIRRSANQADGEGHSTSVIPNSWNYVEYKLDLPNKTATMRLNGYDITTISLDETIFNDNVYSVGNKITLYWGSWAGVSYQYSTRFLMDDLYILDGSGTINNDFLGNVKVATRPPTVDSEVSFEPSVTETVSNTELLSGSYDSSTDSYVYSNTIGQRDFYKSNVEIPDKKIHAIGTGVLSRRPSGDSLFIKQTLRSGETVVNNSAMQYNTDQYTGEIVIYETDPNGDIEWTKSSVEASEFGFETLQTPDDDNT